MVKSPEAFLVNHATCRARATVIQACRNPVHKIRRTRSDSAGEVVVVEAAAAVAVVVVVVVGMAMERDDEGEGWRVEGGESEGGDVVVVVVQWEGKTSYCSC